MGEKLKDKDIEDLAITGKVSRFKLLHFNLLVNRMKNNGRRS